MNRKLASVQTILSVEPIEGADKIEKIKVLGWTLVAQKDEFKPGDRCVFFEVDLLLPSENPNFAFMAKYNYRIRTIKLRGILSQGLALPLSTMPEGYFYQDGDDVTDLIGVKKYEVLARFSSGPNSPKLQTWPFYVPKTDETRIQSEPELLNEMKGLPYYITTKMDGASATYLYKDGFFKVCSRNNEVEYDENSWYWQVAKKYDLENKFKVFGKNYAIQGELCGPGIQKNRLNLKERDLFVFSAYNIDEQRYLNYKEMLYFIYAYNFGLEIVPQEEFPLTGFDYSLEQLLKMAQGKYLDTNNEKEGIVVRPLEETYSKTLKGRLSFKVLNNSYLLKEE